ncbi:SDR family oxidoreductase [Pectinatus sottacetonis]|uniref:SDR family oxidoreductase n=1 Tax=Pectinatus sottacetonis TaxID=1002795 RepID=UPI0018C60797|nr:SDR family oxidoreductase [Pectinatus sottacetonis]
MSWLDIEGKTAIVTGGASGIGKTIAQSFLDNGANVIVCDMNPNGVKLNTENGGSYLYVVTDVTKSASIKNMLATAKKQFPHIDILVNNAGINIPRLLVDTKKPYSEYELDEAVFNKVSAVNLKGVFLCAQIIGHEFINNGSGIIINMSSESGLEGSEGQSIYAATKNAVNSFTRSWAKELGRHNIRIVGVAPGIMEATGLRTQAYEEALSYTRGITVKQLREGYTNTKTIPLGREGKLSEVADMVMFLSSKRASYVHGITINVAGGKTRG